MPVFEYQAIGSSGRASKGTIDADNVRTARQRLRSQGLYPTEIREAADVGKNRTQDVRKYFRTTRVSVKDLGIATRQLATLTGAGLPLVSALQALAEQTDNPALKRVIVEVRENVEQGSALAKALGAYPKVFPRLYVNMVASGEASGTLDTVLENLADYLESQLEMRRRITSALFYPALMLTFCSLVVVALLVFVVPSIVEIFQKQGIELPLPTKILLAISDGLASYWILLLATIGLIAWGLRWAYLQPKGRERFDRWLLKTPVIGSTYLKINTARLARTMGTLLNGGVGLLTAMEIVRNIVGNVHIVKAIETAHEGVREGRSLAKELGRTGYFPSLLIQMISVGETSGKLEAMLAKAGRAYENEVNATLDGLTRLIEPLMMMGVGGIVFSIVIAMLLPMSDLVSKLQF